MLGDLSGVSKIFVITGRTDMRKSFDGLMAIVRDSYDLDPYANALFLFCGRDCRKIKALHFDKDGFVLMQKVAGVFSGHAMHRKHACLQGRNSDGSWRVWQSISLRQSKQETEKKTSDVCTKQRKIKTFFRS